MWGIVGLGHLASGIAWLRARVQVAAGALSVNPVTASGEGTAATQELAAAVRLVEQGRALLALGEVLPELLYAKDRAGRTVYANPATLAAIGCPADAILGHTAAEYLGESIYAQAVMERDRRIMAQGAAEVIEEETFDPRVGGTRVWQSNRMPLRDPVTGEVVGLIGISRDVTNERRLEASEAGQVAERVRLRDLLETLDLGASMTRDMDGSVRFWSEGCVSTYGWTAEEAVGQVAHDLLRTVFPIPMAGVEAALERDGEWTGDLRQRTRDGREIIVFAHKVLRRAPDGRPLAVLESLTEVTAHRQAAAALADLNRRHEEQVREEVAARQDVQKRAALTERMQSLGQLASGIAHDFNNVLQAVQGGITLIERRAADAGSVRRFAGTVLRAADRGAAVTRQLLAFARRDELRAERIEPSTLLANMRDMLGNMLGGRMTVRADSGAGLPVMMADRVQLEAVLVSLAANARDAMPDGGTFTLAAVAEEVVEDPAYPAELKPGRYVRLSVTDTGTGMDPETAAHAVEPFFTTKTRERGTGLGLSMAKGFAEQSGGDLAIESTPGRGTTVTLWLPTLEAAAVAPAGTAPAFLHACGAVPRVLFVDDDDLVRETLAASLQDAGLAVLTAGSGVEALALLEAGEVIDVLVSDFSMPGISGITLIREAQTRRPGLPAILLTGYARDSTHLAVDGALTGTFSLLRKPIAADRLVERIQALVGAGVESKI